MFRYDFTYLINYHLQQLQAQISFAPVASPRKLTELSGGEGT
jgi:hypothetical protein